MVKSSTASTLHLADSVNEIKRPVQESKHSILKKVGAVLQSKPFTFSVTIIVSIVFGSYLSFFSSVDNSEAVKRDMSLLLARIDNLQSLVEYDNERIYITETVASILQKKRPNMSTEMRVEIGRSVFEAWKLYKIPPALTIAIIDTESNFNTTAISSKGARGLMQVMPLTGSYISQILSIPNYSTDSLFHPTTNIQIGTYYLSTLHNQFRLDVPEGDFLQTALSAYWMGPTAVSSKLSNHSVGFKTSYSQEVLAKHEFYIREYRMF